MTALLSKNDQLLVNQVNKLNKYICAYPSRGANITGALNNAGCKKLLKVFELANEAESEKDVEKLRTSIKSFKVYVEQYQSREFAVSDALKPTGVGMLNKVYDAL